MADDDKIKIVDLESFLLKFKEEYPTMTWEEAAGAHMMVDTEDDGYIGEDPPPATFEQKFSHINFGNYRDLVKGLHVLNGTNDSAKAILAMATEIPSPLLRGALKAGMTVGNYANEQANELYARDMAMGAMIWSLIKMGIEHHDARTVNPTGHGVHTEMRAYLKQKLNERLGTEEED